MRKLLTFLTVIIITLNLNSQAVAQSQLENMRFTRMMVPVDAVTLKTEGVEIRLWGILPASSTETHLNLRAMELMQNLINNAEVTCKVVAASDVTKPAARCSTRDGEDLALRLLQNGLVVRDRRALYDSVFASSYQEAEAMAANNQRGIWALVRGSDTGFIDEVINDNEKLMIAILILIGLPVLAMIILGLIVHRGIRKLLNFQTEEANNRYADKQRLHIREKNLVLTQIETELEENKSRVEAFLTVYMEMLSNIKDRETTAQYQQSGDVVSLQPSFSKDAFRGNYEKLSALDVKLASELGKFYDKLSAEAEYLDLPPSTPREEAISIVDKIVSDAREFLPAIDRVLSLIQAHKSQSSA